jgi:drug/metabolite transporter (DMT)-like permease
MRVRTVSNPLLTRRRPMQSNNPQRMTYIVLGVGLLAVSFAAILIRFAQLEGVPSLYIAAFRLGGAALLVAPLTLRRHSRDLRAISRHDWLLLSISGVFLAAHFAFWTLSLEYTSVLISVTLVTTTPIWTALLEGIFLRQFPRGIILIGLIITVGGGLLLGIPSGSTGTTLSMGSAPLLGGTLATLGAIAIAIYLTIGRKLRAGLALLPYIWIVYGIGALVLFPVLLTQNIPLTGYSINGYLWLLALAVIPQLIGHSSLNYAVKYVSATYITILTKLEPIISATVAFFIFAEIPGIWEVIGSVVILIGVIVASLPIRRSHSHGKQPGRAVSS